MLLGTAKSFAGCSSCFRPYIPKVQSLGLDQIDGARFGRPLRSQTGQKSFQSLYQVSSGPGQLLTERIAGLTTARSRNVSMGDASLARCYLVLHGKAWSAKLQQKVEKSALCRALARAGPFERWLQRRGEQVTGLSAGLAQDECPPSAMSAR